MPKKQECFQRSVSKRHMEAVLDTFPFLQLHQQERCLFFWIESGVHRYDRKSKGIVASREHMAFIVGREETHYRAGKDLQSLKNNVLPELRWMKPDYREKECRVLTAAGIDAWSKQWVHDHSPDRVWVHTLKKVTSKDVVIWHKQQRELYRQKIYNTEDQRIMTEYLHSLPLKLFLDIRDQHIEEAFAWAKEQNDGGAASRLLQQFYDHPFPFYDLSRAGKTDRVYAVGLPFLAKAGRHILIPEGREADLQNCQLAIFAGRLGMTSILNRLAGGRSIWPDLLDFLGVLDNQREATKNAAKQAMYSIMYGMSAGYAQMSLEDELLATGIMTDRRFLEYPLIQEIRGAMVYVKEKIRNEGGMMSAYGWRDYDPDTDINSFYAGINQSFEQAIMGALYREVIKMNEQGNYSVRIILHQHDGCTLIFKPGADVKAINQRLQRRVIEKGKEFGIPIFLTID